MTPRRVPDGAPSGSAPSRGARPGSARRLGAPRRRADGFTLIELVAVLAIFALVAVMGLQALTGALFQRSALERLDAEAAALSRSLALMRRDLEQALPATFQPVTGPLERAFLAEASGGRFALSMLGHPVPDTAPGSGMARVVWRLDRAGGRLTRQVWPGLQPSRADLVGPEVAMLEGVEALAIEPLGEWNAEAPESLPPGFAVTLTTRRHGALRLVVAR